MTAWIICAAFVLLSIVGVRWAGRFGPLGSVLGSVVVGALFFKVVFPGYVLPGGLLLPGIAMSLVGSSFPLPLPGTAFWTFMLLIVMAGLVAVTSDDEWMRDFFAPILVFLRGEGSPVPAVVRRGVLYGLIPLGVGWIILSGFMPGAAAPIESRQAHPTLRYDENWQNPLREPSTERLEAFAAEEDLADLDRADLLERFRESVLHEGRHLYGRYCSPCHGGKADGTGPMARGFRLQPADFTDPGTIATIVEGYAYKRIRDGGIGLPGAGTPWDSAMPSWKDDLDDEEIYKILLAEYDLAGVSPRVPESHE